MSSRYPSDVSDEEWAFVAPYLALVTPEARQRKHDLRATFDAERSFGSAGSSGPAPPGATSPPASPHGPPPRQQTQRWIKAGVFEAMAHDLRVLLRGVCGRKAHPSAAIFDGTTLTSTPESGGRAGYDGAKRRRARGRARRSTSPNNRSA